MIDLQLVKMEIFIGVNRRVRWPTGKEASIYRDVCNIAKFATCRKKSQNLLFFAINCEILKKPRNIKVSAKNMINSLNLTYFTAIKTCLCPSLSNRILEI